SETSEQPGERAQVPAETFDVLRIVAEAPFHFARERQIALALLGGAGALDERDPLVGIAVEQRDQELRAGEVRRDLSQARRINPLVRLDGDRFLHTFSCHRCDCGTEIPTPRSIYFPILAI